MPLDQFIYLAAAFLAALCIVQVEVSKQHEVEKQMSLYDRGETALFYTIFQLFFFYALCSALQEYFNRF